MLFTFFSLNSFLDLCVCRLKGSLYFSLQGPDIKVQICGKNFSRFSFANSVTMGSGCSECLFQENLELELRIEGALLD